MPLSLWKYRVSDHLVRSVEMCAWRSLRWTARMIRPIGLPWNTWGVKPLGYRPVAVCKVFQRHHGGNISLAAVSFWSFEVPVCQKIDSSRVGRRGDQGKHKKALSTWTVWVLDVTMDETAAPWMACSWCIDMHREHEDHWSLLQVILMVQRLSAEKAGCFVFQLVTGAPQWSFVPGVPGKNLHT